MLAWLKQNLWWVTAMSLALSVAGILAVAVFIIRMPADHFGQNPSPAAGGHPVVRWIRRALKNLAGIVLLVVGILMALPLVPGPGLLIVLIGVSLTDFPGKRAIEIWIIRKPLVLEPINWLRGKCNRPPLQLPPPNHPQ